jgi:hypothetical protein
MEHMLQMEKASNQWNRIVYLVRLVNIVRMECSIMTTNALQVSSVELELLFQMIKTCYVLLAFIVKRALSNQLSAATVLSQLQELKPKKNALAVISDTIALKVQLKSSLAQRETIAHWELKLQFPALLEPSVQILFNKQSKIVKLVLQGHYAILQESLIHQITCALQAISAKEDLLSLHNVHLVSIEQSSEVPQ